MKCRNCGEPIAEIEGHLKHLTGGLGTACNMTDDTDPRVAEKEAEA